jgi:hypothetical protein
MAIGQTPLEAIEELVALLTPPQLAKLGEIFNLRVDMCNKVGHRFKRLQTKRFGWFANGRVMPHTQHILFCDRCGKKRVIEQ